MNQSLTFSDSLIYGLCREIEYIRQRSKNISYTLSTCKDKVLKLRLKEEIEKLELRIEEVINISNELKTYSQGSISIMLLVELCNRSIMLNS